MAYQTWVWTPTTAQAAGSAYANSTSETNILPTQALFTLPANILQIGSTLRLNVAGAYSNTGTPTLRVLLRYGAVGSGVIWFDTTALTTPTGVTNQSFVIQALLTVRALGSGTSSNLMAIGTQLGMTSATAPTLVPATGPAASSGFDSTTATQVNLSAIWGTASASNTLTLHLFSLELMN